MKYIQKIIKKLGLLRVLLSIVAVVLILTTPLSDTSMSPQGWGIVQAIMLPALAPLVFMVLCLDIIMSQILKTKPDKAEQQRFHFIIKWNTSLALLLAFVWVPVFLRNTALV